MTSARAIPFKKMNGIGNDFVVLDARGQSLALGASAMRLIADRTAGIGCDQVIVLERSDKADVRMRIWNPDGSEVGACGNATRCIAALLKDEMGRSDVTIETGGGLLGAHVEGPDDITIDMGEPRFGWADIPLAEPFHDTRAIELQIGPIDAPVLHSPSVVNVGNPHAVFWVDDVDAHDLGRFGPLLENHPIFPDRANISLAQVTSPTTILVRTWERGAGLTKACGTAACAVAVCAMRKKLVERKVRVSLPGGDLVIEWTPANRVLMTGPAELEFQGRLEPERLARAVG